MIFHRLLLAAGLLVLASAAAAADLYVSNSGSDVLPRASVTQLLPWKTIQHAASSAVAGDTVYIRAGNYPEQVKVGVSGTSTAQIVFRNYPGENPTMDETSQTVSGSNGSLIAIVNHSYITIQGLTLQNWTTTNSSFLPVGIEVTGACVGIQIRGNVLHHIWQSNTSGGDAHGVRVYGSNATAISQFVMDGNQIYDMRTGSSEVVSINGNVTDFKITNNIIHDVNNIGIDLIGFENTYSGTANPPASVDRARNGVVADNTIYNVDSRYNPAYNGDFTTGGGDAAADGLYADGGQSIVIERNFVYACNYGVELASEHSNGSADTITLRDNIIHHCHLAGLAMGGYSSTKGTAVNCLIANNTFFQNNTIYPLDTSSNNSGQIFLQFYVTNCTFKNNIVWARSDTGEMILHYPGGGTTAQKELGTTNTFLDNLYYCDGATPVWEAYHNGKHNVYSSLSAWQASGVCAGDAGSTIANPLFQGGEPGQDAQAPAYQLAPGSPAVNTGQASPAYQPGSGELDFFKKARVRGARVDRGADEQ